MPGLRAIIASGALPDPLKRRCDAFFGAALADGRPVALIVDDRLPQYDRHAGGLGMFHYVRLFRELGFAVVFVPHDRRPEEPYGQALRAIGVEVCDSGFEFLPWARRYGARVAVAWLSRPYVARHYLPAIRAESHAPIIYCGRDLNYLRMRRQAAVESRTDLMARAESYEEAERELLLACDAVVTFSTVESEMIAAMTGTRERVHVVPAYIYDIHPPSGRTFEERRHVLFVGGFRHGPNADGIRWLLEAIWPAIRATVPEIRLVVVGQEPERLGTSAPAGVSFAGHVPDLAALYNGARLSVAPLRYGAGVKGKIVESLAYGVPVVATSVGAEGMGLTGGIELLLADGPGPFAQHVAALWHDKRLWSALSSAGRSFVADAYSHERARAALAGILGRLHVEGFAMSAATA